MLDGLGKYTKKEKFSRLKSLHLIYGVAGGFFFSSLFDLKTRRLWYGLAAFITSFYVGLEICLLKNIMMGNKDYADLSSTIILHACIAGCLMAAVVAFINFYFREEQEWGLNQNKDRQEMMEHLKERTDLKNINKVMLCCYIICNISYVGLLMCHIIFGLSIANGPEELREAKWQIFPNPFATFLDNEMEFVGLTIGLYMPYPILMYVALCDALLSLAAAREYYLSAAILWTSMERFSEESTVTFENLNERLACMDQTRHLQESDYVKLREIEREYLRQKIRSAILDHQQNIKQVELILPLVQLKFVYQLIGHVIIFLIIIFALYSDFFPLIQKLKAFFIVVIVSVTWFCVCYTGEILTELGETLLDKVNNIPWYYLDPPRRKDYYIFVCMAQEPIVITAMGWYQSGMPIYMQVMKACYSYFNFLRSI